jgi:hypothetical protein
VNKNLVKNFTEMKIFKFISCVFLLVTVMACNDDDSGATLQNDYIMKTVAPAIVGEPVEFAYAMGTHNGILKVATAEASIGGAPGTGFDAKFYHTDARGNEVGVLAADTITQGSISTATFSVDTAAATLRFNYVVPATAKGKNFSLTFKGTNSAGETTSISTPEYRVSKMDLKRDILMTSRNIAYFSLETMESYTEGEVMENGMQEKIDLVYLYDAVNPDGIPYGHALVSPATDAKYLNGLVIPASFKKNKTKIEKHVFIKDMQLSGTVPATYVDDIDLETLELGHALDFVLGLTNYNSVFVESEDGKYRAYLYFNQARSRKLIFGIKRLKVE